MSLFGSDSAPSVTFPAPGTTRVCVITEEPSLKQSRNFATKELESWPDGSPKKIVLIPVTVDGEARALWVTPGTALAAAIREAEVQAGVSSIAMGGTLTISFTHEVPSSKGAGFHPAKQFAVQYAPGSAFAKGPSLPPAPPRAEATYYPPAQPQTPAPAVTSAPAGAVSTASVGGAKALSPEQYAALAAAGVDMAPFTVAV